MLETEGGQLFLSDLDILAVSLVPDNDQLHLFIGVLFDFVHPELLDVLESFADLQVEDQDDALSIFVVSAGDGTESLLASGIPDLQLDCFVIEFERSASQAKLLKLEVNAYCGEVAFLERVVSESSEERRLANGTVSDQDGLELELLGHVVSFVGV